MTRSHCLTRYAKQAESHTTITRNCSTQSSSWGAKKKGSIMTQWFHRCKYDWLCARQGYLTATDIKELLPVTKTGRKRSVTNENYFKVLSKKLVGITKDDCISTGAAARGHILEPYAIDRYNKVDYGSNEWLYHWDDIIVTRKEAEKYSLAFSPDALNIDSSCVMGKTVVAIDGIKTIGEVKSYGAERHLIAGYTPKGDLEERWQVATAMAVCPTIETAYLLFYNPSMVNQLFIVDYDRSELAREIDIVLDIEASWLDWVKHFNLLDEHFCVIGHVNEEQSIISSIMKQEELNPEGEKSVIR